jgi:hypothetical protein
MAEAPVPMKEIVLQIHDQKGRFFDVRSLDRRLDFAPTWIVLAGWTEI